MSKILSDEVKEVVYKKVRTLRGIKCDICGKVITTDWRNDANKYFEVVTGHNDWGNDSWESRQHFDICLECIGSFTQEYLTYTNGYDSRYIDIKTEWCTAREVGE